MLMRFLNFLLNRLPIFKKVDGQKTKIAGALIALAGLILALAPFVPAPYDVYALSVAHLIEQVAQVLGTVGVAGILAKKWDLPKLPNDKPEAPELIKK